MLQVDDRATPTRATWRARRSARRTHREAYPGPPLASIIDPRDVYVRRLAVLRRVAIATWVTVVTFQTVSEGVAFNRELVLLYIATGLAAASIGQRRVMTVIRDWLPFAIILLLYDLTRGAATLVGTPTLWHWQIDADRWLFFGTVPTVWLQEHIKMAQPPLWEVIISTCYMSFFILPYVIAGVLWLKSRDDWKAFVRRFVVINFSGLLIYVLLPAAPPWAAARCTAAEVADGPSDPACIYRHPSKAPDGGILGAMQTHLPGANDYIERISTRGWATLHLHVARSLVDSGQASVNLVAAIPSLHAGLSLLAALFLWRRVTRKWRPFLAAYVVIMAFTLVYSAEHYVIDLLLGWALAIAVQIGVNRWEARRKRDDRPPEPEPPPAEARISDEPVFETSRD